MEVVNFDGMEQLIVVAVGLDAEIKSTTKVEVAATAARKLKCGRCGGAKPQLAYADKSWANATADFYLGKACRLCNDCKIELTLETRSRFYRVLTRAPTLVKTIKSSR